MEAADNGRQPAGNNGQSTDPRTLAPLIPQAHGGALRRLPKGVSGNPSGRPRGLVSTAYRKYLKRQAPEAVRAKLQAKGYDVRTGADALAVGQLESGIKGFAPCARELREATEGRAPDHLEVTGANAGPMEIRVIVAHIGMRDLEPK